MLKLDVDGEPKTSSYDGGASIYTVAGRTVTDRTGVLVLGELRSIGGADGWKSLDIDDKFCIELDWLRDVDASVEFGMLEFDEIEVSGTTIECSGDAVLSLWKLELDDILKCPIGSYPDIDGVRNVRPDGSSGNAGKMCWVRPLIECGTLPITIGSVITRFL